MLMLNPLCIFHMVPSSDNELCFPKSRALNNFPLFLNLSKSLYVTSGNQTVPQVILRPVCFENQWFPFRICNITQSGHKQCRRTTNVPASVARREIHVNVAVSLDKLQELTPNAFSFCQNRLAEASINVSHVT